MSTTPPAPPAFEIDDTGFVAVKIGPTEKRLDLFLVYNLLVSVMLEAEDAVGNPDGADRETKKALHRNAATVKLLDELGFGACSHAVAIRFTNHVFGLVGGLEKKGESPASPSPSAS